MRDEIVSAIERMNRLHPGGFRLALLLVEPKHGGWGLYLSRADDAEELMAGDYEFQNVAAGDVPRASADYPRERLWDEFSQFLPEVADRLAAENKPDAWALQVNDDFGVLGKL